MMLSSIAWAQKEIVPTNEFIVTGSVQKELKFTLKDIESLPAKDIVDMEITNHRGESRSVLQKVKGVLVKDLLKDLQLKEDNVKLFSEFYFIFIASDNYRVVYSWNEIFNSPTGDNLYIVTSIGGEGLSDLQNRILVVTPTDFKTGRRYIKGLSRIKVARAD